MHDMHVSSSSYDRQVTEAPFHIIAGSGEKTLSEHTCPNSGLGGTGDHHADLRSAAIYLANLHRAAYDTNVGVWADAARGEQPREQDRQEQQSQQAQRQREDSLTALPALFPALPALPHPSLPAALASHNVVLVGGPQENAITQHFANQGLLPLVFGPQDEGEGNVAIAAGAFAIGRCVFSGPGIGLVTIFPMRRGLHLNVSAGQGGQLGLLVAGTDAQGLRDALTMGQPTIPPMVRAPYTNMQPDFVVTGPDFAWKGVGGILAAGYWGNTWKFEPSSSYTQDDCTL